MSIRLKLLLIVIAIVGLIAAGEGLLLRSLTRDLEHDLGEAVTRVSQSLITEIRLVRFSTGDEPGEHSTSSSEAEADGSQVDLEEGPPEIRTLIAEVDGDGHPAARRKIGIVGGDLDHAAVFNHLSELGVELDEDERSLLLDGPSHRLRLDIPREGVHDTMREFGRKLLLGSAGVALVGLLLTGLLAHRVTTPLRRLAKAATEVGEGHLGVQVEATADGEVGVALRAFNDMSQRLAALEADAEALRSNQHLSELGEVGRGLAHSLRNPLNTLGLAVGEIELLAQDNEAHSETAHRLATNARRQITRIDRALRSFLALSTGAIGPTENREVDLVDLARDVALEASQSARALPSSDDADGTPSGSVRIEVEAPGGNALVLGVEAELRAAIHALVINAVEASQPGERVVVTVAASDHEGSVRIRDWGCGIPEEVLSRLFTPHVTTKPQGAGIGLYLAHRIATTRYRGSLQIEAAEGGGTLAELVVRDRAEPAS